MQRADAVAGSGRLVRRRVRFAVCAFALLAAGCARRCGGLGGTGPIPPPTVRDKDGTVHHLVDKGPYKAIYDRLGRIERIEYDSNGDGRPDHIAHHEGNKTPRRIDVDTDFDGRTDRWEYYSVEGQLEKIGVSRRGSTAPDLWLYSGPNGEPVRKEYDEDGDGKVDRSEILESGRVVKLELDSDHDGAPDRRIRYNARGGVAAIEKITPQPAPLATRPQ